MKKLTLFISPLFYMVILTACGGGGTDSANITPVNPMPSTSGKIVIDNGRGTSNNQDTERPK